MALQDDRRPWIERLVASRSVRASYASLLAHVLALVLLALLVTAPRNPTGPTILRLAFAQAPLEPAREVGLDLGEAGPASDRGETMPPTQAVRPADPAPPAAVTNAALPATDTAAAIGSEPAEAGERPERPPKPPTPLTAAEPAAAATPAGAAAGSGATAEPAAVVEPASETAGTAAPAAAPAAAPGSGKARDPFADRRGSARAEGVAARGGSEASEAAVAKGLEWLARHQAADGSWRFNLSGCQCDGACRQPGTVTSTTAATGIALLPFLGAGQTHEAGEHRETVTRGLYYLMSRMQVTPRGGDLSEGTMYGHGAATLALAEALGMTGDKMLRPYVRDAVRFIETAQDMHGGGWRYLPGQAGDTTVTAWQLAALKSAALAGAAVPSPTIDGICRFLDRVQVRNGEGYGYLAPQDRPCTSAIGLLCRVYTAWPEQVIIDRGLARLARKGPDPEAVYQNFYLSQALLLRQHSAWPRWNRLNREHLIARQTRVGHESGSWSFTEPDTAPGGRLGHTALAILTLEVYYRLLPIYSADAAEMRW